MAHLSAISVGSPTCKHRQSQGAIVFCLRARCGGEGGSDGELNEQFPTLMPMYYPGSKVTGPRPHRSLDAMWRAFSDLAHTKTPAVNNEKHFLCLSLRRERGHPPR